MRQSSSVGCCNVCATDSLQGPWADSDSGDEDRGYLEGTVVMITGFSVEETKKLIECARHGGALR